MAKIETDVYRTAIVFSREWFEPQPVYDPAIPPLSSLPLVGREDDLEALKQRVWEGGNASLTVLHGLPGVGKTSLAAALAHDPEVREHFCDGILWVGLGTSPNISGALSRWGRLLGLDYPQEQPLKSYEEWAQALHHILGSRRMLLVIDDAWSVEAAMPFKLGGPLCSHLITTRFPTIASHFTVDGPMLLKELNDEQGMQLLQMLAPHLVEQERPHLSALVQAVGGLPLALNLIGNYLKQQAIGETQEKQLETILRLLRDTEQRLQLRGEDQDPLRLPASTLSLQSVIALTDQQLCEQARMALYALSVLPPKPDTFSEEAALMVADCDSDTLDMLVDAGLLECRNFDRFTLHKTIADYASARLKKLALAPEQGPALRLIRYVLAFLQEQAHEYDAFERESATIMVALEAAFRLGMFPEFIQGSMAFLPFLLMRGSYVLAEQLADRSYRAAMEIQSQQEVMEAIYWRGEIASRKGDFSRANILYLQGVQLARDQSNRLFISAFLSSLGSLAWRMGSYEEAEVFLQEGLAIAREGGYHKYLVRIYKAFGALTCTKGEYDRAIGYLQEGLELARQYDYRDMECYILMNLGVTYAETGDFARAEPYFREGLQTARQLRHRELLCMILLNLGTLSYEGGNYQDADTFLEEGLTIAKSIDLREWVCLLTINRGELKIRQSHFDEAEPYFREGLQLARQIGNRRAIAAALLGYGELHLYKFELEEAEQAFQQALQEMPKSDQGLHIGGWYGLARVAQARGKIDEARERGKTCLRYVENGGHRLEEEIRLWINKLSA